MRRFFHDDTDTSVIIADTHALDRHTHSYNEAAN
jgi:hypothetical protein